MKIRHSHATQKIVEHIENGNIPDAAVLIAKHKRRDDDRIEKTRMEPVWEAAANKRGTAPVIEALRRARFKIPERNAAHLLETCIHRSDAETLQAFVKTVRQPNLNEMLRAAVLACTTCEAIGKALLCDPNFEFVGLYDPEPLVRYMIRNGFFDDEVFSHLPGQWTQVATRLLDKLKPSDGHWLFADAIEQGCVRFCELLCRQKFDINKGSAAYAPALHHAIHADQHCVEDLVTLLLTHGAKPNHRLHGETSLHMLCRTRIQNDKLTCKIIRVLVDHGADVNIATKGKDPRTPLMMACRSGRLELIDELLGHDADPTFAPLNGLQDKTKSNALDMLVDHLWESSPEVFKSDDAPEMERALVATMYHRGARINTSYRRLDKSLAQPQEAALLIKKWAPNPG